MKICLINNLFPPILTGSSLFTLDLATQLQRRGHDVIVITSKTTQCKAEFEIHENGFKIYRIYRLRLFKNNLWMNFPDFYLTLFPSNFKRIKEILIQNNVEVIHQCNNIFDLVFVSAYFSRKLKLPLICSLTTQIQHSNPFLNKILELFDKTIIKHFFAKHVDFYITGDKETERYVNERYNRFSGLKILHYGISGMEMFSEINRDYSQTNNILVSLGHVSKIKDRKALIDAWPNVKASIANAKIKIIGSLFSKQIETDIDNYKLKNDIIFTGLVERNKIPEVIKDADIGSMFFSNIPYSKGVGSANIELMASGLPVILNVDENNFGPDKPFKNGIHYVKLESRNPEWLSKKIIELFENPDLRERIGKAGKEFVTTQLTWEKNIPLFENIYAEAIRNKQLKKKRLQENQAQ
jgi:glycosyltransferase involved in cell wall biosynthesis